MEDIKIIKTGFLIKKSKYLDNKNKRFVVLTNKNMFTYTDDKKGADCTMNLDLTECSGLNKGKVGDDQFNFTFNNDKKVYEFSTDKEEERDSWFNALSELIKN